MGKRDRLTAVLQQDRTGVCVCVCVILQDVLITSSASLHCSNSPLMYALVSFLCLASSRPRAALKRSRYNVMTWWRRINFGMCVCVNVERTSLC